MTLPDAFTRSLNNLCFIRWLTGPRLGETFRQHCIAYYYPEERAIRHLRSVNPHLVTLYIAVVESERALFTSYTDEQAEQILSSWASDHALQG